MLITTTITTTTITITIITITITITSNEEVEGGKMSCPEALGRQEENCWPLGLRVV